MSRRTTCCLFLSLFILGSTEIGWGQGVITLPQTGRTKCYDAWAIEISCSGTGQDGEYQAGVEWPVPRFTVSGDCVTDNLTGLMWSKNANLPNGGNWQGALDYVASMNSGAGLCGYKDWRLPNINELESLVNADEANNAAWLNSQGFVNVQSSPYWSSTTFAYNSIQAWLVNMLAGDVYYWSKAGGLCVWPVRSGPPNNPNPLYPANVWKTGQTAKYATGDDGDLERGVSLPTPRFTDHGDGTITDNLTGLMWAKNANLPNGGRGWEDALTCVKLMNSGAGLYGYYDWRLPNRKELFSLIDHSRYNPPLPAGHPFQNVQSSPYWSSTTSAYYSYYSWSFYTSYGLVYDADWPLNFYVWPVRSGLGYSDISVTPNPVPFGSVNTGGTSDQTITVKNDGNANLVIGTITSPSAPFSKQTDNCSGQSIPPAGTCTLTYRFAPTSGGTVSSNSNIPSNDPDENPKTIILTGTGVTVCPTPGTPSGPSPSNGAVGISTSLTLTWAATSDTDSYDVYFGTTNPPATKVDTTTSTSYTPTSALNFNTAYYWKIVAKNNCGSSTAGPVWSFTTVCPTPGNPSSPSPANTATGVPTNPTLSWTATANIDSYDLYFGTVNPPPFAVNVTGTNYPSSGLNTNTTCYWRIVAKNNCGSSTTGPVWTFTTICPLPGAFSYTSPVDGSTNQSTDIGLDWEDAPGAASYDVYFGISNPPAFVINKTGSSYVPGTLSYGTTYYWKIVAKNGCGENTGSVWSFTTCSLPSVPFAPTPSNGSEGISTDSTLIWNSDIATSYDVYFGTTSPPPLITTVVTTTYDLPPLSHGTTYYWKIVAENGCGENAGPVWSFKTFYLDISPKDGTIGTEITIKGENFGLSKGKAYVDVSALKILTWGTKEIYGFLTKAMLPGAYDVSVTPKTPKGAPSISEIDGFTVKVPEIDSLSLPSGFTGQVITINGIFFGSKKGKVYLEGGGISKSCKVVSWTMDPPTGVGQIQFQVPKGLAKGTYDLRVENKVGSVTETDGFEVK